MNGGGPPGLMVLLVPSIINTNSNLVMLIPKFSHADRIEDYRPIYLAKF